MLSLWQRALPELSNKVLCHWQERKEYTLQRTKALRRLMLLTDSMSEELNKNIISFNCFSPTEKVLMPVVDRPLDRQIFWLRKLGEMKIYSINFPITTSSSSHKLKLPSPPQKHLVASWFQLWVWLFNTGSSCACALFLPFLISLDNSKSEFSSEAGLKFSRISYQRTPKGKMKSKLRPDEWSC